MKITPLIKIPVIVGILTYLLMSLVFMDLNLTNWAEEELELLVGLIVGGLIFGAIAHPIWKDK